MPSRRKVTPLVADVFTGFKPRDDKELVFPNACHFDRPAFYGAGPGVKDKHLQWHNISGSCVLGNIHVRNCSCHRDQMTFRGGSGNSKATSTAIPALIMGTVSESVTTTGKDETCPARSPNSLTTPCT